MPGRELIPIKQRTLTLKEEAVLPISVVSYEHVNDSFYTFSKVIDQRSSIRMDETTQDYQKSEFVNANFDASVNESKKEYYLAAAASGLLTATLSTSRLSDLFELRDKLSDKKLEEYLILAARAAGYKKKDYKGAIQYLLKVTITCIQGYTPDSVKEYIFQLLLRL